MAPTNTNLVVGIEADAGGIKNGVAQASASLRGLSATMRQTGAAAQNALGGKAVQGFWRAQSGEGIWNARSTPLSAAEIFPDFKEPAKAARELGTSVGGISGGMSLATAHTSKFTSMLSAAVPFAAALFSARMVGSWVAGVVSAVDKTAELSKALDASVSGMQKIQYVAKLTGIEIEDVSQNISMLTRRIGSGQAKSALEKLGLDAEAVKNQNPDKVMMEVVYALNKVAPASARAALAMDLFGRSGIKMLTMAAEGEGKLRAMTDEATRLGVVTGGDVAADFGELADNLDKAWQGLKGLTITILTAAMPVLKTATSVLAGYTEIAVFFARVMTYTWPAAAERGQAAFEAHIKSLREVAAEARNTGRISQEEYNKLQALYNKRLRQGPPRSASEQAAFDEEAAENEKRAWKDKVSRAREIEASMRSDLQKRKDEIMEIQRLEEEGLLKRGTAAEAMRKFQDEPRKYEEARMRAEASAMMVNNMTPAERFQESLADMDRLLKAGMLSAEDYNRQLTAISKTYTEAEFGDQMRQFEADKQKGKGLAESMMTPWEKARANMAEAEDLFSKGLIDAQTLQRTREKEFAPFMAAEQQRMRDMMGEVPQEAARSIDALSGGDIVGQVRRGQLGGAMDLQQEQLNTQKRMEKWLAILAGGGVTPAFSWGR
jgi:hypothetical protein